jgi:hypothetical protein
MSQKFITGYLDNQNPLKSHFEIVLYLLAEEDNLFRGVYFDENRYVGIVGYKNVENSLILAGISSPSLTKQDELIAYASPFVKLTPRKANPEWYDLTESIAVIHAEGLVEIMNLAKTQGNIIQLERRVIELDKKLASRVIQESEGGNNTPINLEGSALVID